MTAQASQESESKIVRIIGRQEQQMIDRLWQERTGLPLLLLMESAARAVSNACIELAGDRPAAGTRILVLAGKGQNGGDAFACARQLNAAGFKIICRELFPDDKLPPEADANRQALYQLGFSAGNPTPNDFSDLGDGDLIIDGIFGTGYKADRPLPQNVTACAEMSEAARRRGAKVIAIDVPSGLDADSGAVASGAFKGDVTVTFVRRKIGLCAAPGRFSAGRVIVDNIGISEDLVEEAAALARQAGGSSAFLSDPSHIRAQCPKRPPDSHKGTFGKAVIMGGAPGMPGAIALAAEAAARSGAGLITVIVPEAITGALLAARPDCLLRQLPGDADDVGQLTDTLIKLKPAVAVGPGAGSGAWLRPALTRLIQSAEQLVLDADALNHIASDRPYYFSLLSNRPDLGLPPPILTPHPGEFLRLAPEITLADRQAAARYLAKESRSFIVLKGASTVIANPDGSVWINPTGHEGLARGGSGDVLCGLITGLLAQGLPPEEAAVTGVYLHGLAADLAAKPLGHRAMLPSDVIHALPEAYRAAGWEES